MKRFPAKRGFTFRFALVEDFPVLGRESCGLAHTFQKSLTRPYRSKWASAKWKKCSYLRLTHHGLVDDNECRINRAEHSTQVEQWYPVDTPFDREHAMNVPHSCGDYHSLCKSRVNIYKSTM